MLNFAIPGFYDNRKVVIFLCALWRSHPELFQDELNINAVYGNFSFCTWDGGRIFSYYPPASKEDIENIYNTYNNELQIPIRLIFTNPLIKQEHCYDRYNNFIATQLENEMNEIVVNSPILEEYLRQNYPEYGYISSTTKCLNIKDLKQELNNDRYKFVCWNYNLNHNNELINNLNQKEKDKSELLVNAICDAGCPYREEHYKLNGMSSLSYNKPYHMRGCSIRSPIFMPNRGCNNIPIDIIIKDYYSKGLSHFKLEGRTYPEYDLSFDLVRYLVKSEWKDYVLNYLLSNLADFSIDNFNLKEFQERYFLF